jgi:hypothetical protein
MKALLYLSLFLLSLSCASQASYNTVNDQLFPEKCLGEWQGMMYMYRMNKIQDSVKVHFTVAELEKDSVYTWKTEYLSLQTPIVKDYKLVVKDAGQGHYILDEGDDLKLIESHLGTKLVSVFQVNEMLLVSSYEFINDQLIFEVSSGKGADEMSFEMESSNANAPKQIKIKNFSFTNVQRVVLTRD